MNDKKGIKASVLGVAGLFVAALIMAGGFLILFPIIHEADPVSRNVASYQIRNKFCEPRIKKDIECLKACMPSPDERQKACSAKNDKELAQVSPCSESCAINWKTQSVLCASWDASQKAVLDGTEACVYEGAVIALLEWNQEQCLKNCPKSKKDDPDFMTVADVCMTECVKKGFLDGSPPKEWPELRKSCRLKHERGAKEEPLDSKRKKERTFADCVLAGMP